MAGPALTNADVADILQIARARIVRLLRRRGVVTDDDASGTNVVNADTALADNESALAALAAASVAGTVPAGPALRRQDPVKLRSRAELAHTKGLCAAEHGFSLHAATTAGAEDRAGKEALCKYILRPPIAQDRIQLVADDLVRLTLKRPFSDGTFALEMDPLSLLVRLASSVPPPRMNQVRYAGVLAANSKWRACIVPPPPVAETDDGDCATCTAKKDKPPTHRCGYRPWRELLRRTFKIDVEHCDRCGARMKLRARHHQRRHRALPEVARRAHRATRARAVARAPVLQEPHHPPQARRARPGGAVRRALNARSTTPRSARFAASRTNATRALPTPGLTRLAPEPIVP
ncbi:MAG: transposase [Polyangiaceae bacterium]|nr:transposase [Polyangiaceae bacterium]